MFDFPGQWIRVLSVFSPVFLSTNSSKFFELKNDAKSFFAEVIKIIDLKLLMKIRDICVIKSARTWSWPIYCNVQQLYVERINMVLEWFVNCPFILVCWSSLTSNDLSLSWPSWPPLCSSSAFESSDSRIFNSLSLLVVSSESWTPVKVSMGGANIIQKNNPDRCGPG